jgi:hypothetical protein
VVTAENENRMKANQIHQQVAPRRVLSLLWIRREADRGERETVSPTREDAYFTGWFSASAITTIGLAFFIGASAFAIALILALAVRWQLKHSLWRMPERTWWYCWMVLLIVGVGLAVVVAHRA